MSQPSPLKKASSRCSLRLICRRFACEEMRILAFALVFSLACEFRSSLRFPMNFDDKVYAIEVSRKGYWEDTAGSKLDEMLFQELWFPTRINSQLSDLLGGTCSCPNAGGCLRSDKGPWHDLELMKPFKEKLKQLEASVVELSSKPSRIPKEKDEILAELYKVNGI
nr:phosphatidylinositol/phosphatidylcholine transfer protein SFH9-like isoform X1 [Tanacetum cinerariifolium]